MTYWPATAGSSVTPSRVRNGHIAASAAVGSVAVSDGVHWWASRQRMGSPRTTQPRSEVVLVLGYPTRPDGRSHVRQRWRTEIAVRSLDPQCPNGRLIFSGANPRSGRSVAEVMATYARDILGVASERIVLEQRARRTWENVAFSLGPPGRDGRDQGRLRSTHAWKARAIPLPAVSRLGRAAGPSAGCRPLALPAEVAAIMHAVSSWLFRESLGRRSAAPAKSR